MGPTAMYIRNVVTVTLVVATGAWAGEPTKGEKFQPGAAGAVFIEAKAGESLQAAIDRLPEGGGKVVLPAGRFEISQPLVLTKGDVMIEGAGTATHIVNKNEEGKAALVVEPPEGVKELWRVQIADLRVTGNPKSGAGLFIKSVNEPLLSRVSVEHNGGDGVVLDHCIEDPRVCDCLITYNKGTGLNLLGCHDIVVSASQFEENVDAVRCIDGYNLTMTGNNVDDHLGNGVVMENTYGSLITGNMIEECKGPAVLLRRECYGDTVSANTITDNYSEGVRLENVRDITVSANSFVLNAEPSVHALDGACQLTITGNTFCRYTFDPTIRHKLQPAQGIVLESTRDVTISGNHFTFMLKEAIKVAGKDNRRIAITGNTILSPSAGEPGAHAAIAAANLSHSIIANNIIGDEQTPPTLKKPFEFEGKCSANVIMGNVTK